MNSYLWLCDGYARHDRRNPERISGAHKSRFPRNAASKNADRVGDLQFVVSDEPLEREVEGVLILSWKVFVDRLWSGELL